ncbi:uncharacterized protein [Amphiura filiformis]|uniref:uncharacterized protein n=1 Tax=Amphiura filiformis TaxID=82378 RepID=UPI003B223043
MEKAGYDARDHLVPYVPPEWASHLKDIPQYRVQLANHDTPIHRWYLPGVPDGYEVYIKREDMSGADLSGNKVKKLEFILADAIQKGCKSVVTCGSILSNHCRCTALAARRLGLQPHLIVRSPTSNPDEASCSGNALLYRMAGAKMYLAPLKADVFTELLPRVNQLVEKLKKDKNEDAYAIHMGGSSSVGVFGCLDSYEELMEQGVADQFTDIAISTGSSGNTAGLAFGNYLTGSKLKIHGLCVTNDLQYTVREVNRLAEELGLRDSNQSPPSGPNAEEIIDIIEGVRGLGHTISSQEELEFICQVAISTGIVLDASYTGKSAFHLVKQLQENPGRFKGRKILYIHTGGIFGLFDGRMDDVIKKTTASNIHNWMQLSDEVPFNLTPETS